MIVRVEPCTYGTAKAAVERWHYSHKIPRAVKLTYAAFEDDRYIGVMVLGTGVGLGCIVDGVESSELLELQRVAFRDHQAPVTQHVAAVIKRLRAHHRHVRLLVSYADPGQNHHGGIYQAGGWIYTGRTSNATLYRTPRGEFIHSRVVSKTGLKRQFGSMKRGWKEDVFEKIIAPGKFRYVMPLDKRTRRVAVRYSQPYPAPLGASRESSVDGDTPEFRSGGTGSTPVTRSITKAG